MRGGEAQSRRTQTNQKLGFIPETVYIVKESFSVRA
jgi:hypothetical protein